MSNYIYCPGGPNSQTGTAISLRYQNTSIHSSGEKITDVESQLVTNPGPYVVPIWNSHQGEIPAATYVWNLIEESKVKISDLWAKQIEFWFVRKTNSQHENSNLVGSVPVAGTQCSNFFVINNFTLQPYPLTTVAFDGYRNGDILNGVLVAPGQGENEDGYEVVSKETANQNNFTSFVKLAPTIDAQIQSDIFLTGVAMRPLKVFLGEAEQSFFDSIFNSAEKIEDIPKLIFVIKRTAKVGLLFEGQKIYSGDLLDAEELDASDIAIYEEAGKMTQLYSSELKGLFESTFTSLISDDFILHLGVNSCLFACPILGLYTHGYEVETVEPVVRFYINKFFELIDAGVQCRADQLAFFERHKDSWNEKRSEFIEFKIIK